MRPRSAVGLINVRLFIPRDWNLSKNHNTRVSANKTFEKAKYEVGKCKGQGKAVPVLF
jgi:hypothetical protein